jgi:hypothetical protein
MDLNNFRRFLFIISLTTASLVSSLTLANNIDLIRYVDSKKYPDPKQGYFVDLLTLALEASKDRYGDYQLQPVNIEMAQARTSMMLQRNELIDLTWRMTSQTLEQKLQAIYFPILKGLMGYRIFIIRKNQQYLFNKTISLATLQEIDLGQGHNWPDTDILIANGFKVVRGNDVFLLNMLKKERFDYFPRALHEPWLEIVDEKELAVEESLMLQYPAPTFFFVNKQNKRLNQRLSYGLKQLLGSGRFEQFFRSHKVTSGILTKANVNQRITFTLQNPLLSLEDKALLADKRLWIKL